VPDIDVVDSTWLSAPPTTVAAIVAEPSNWRRWWPDLALEVHEWRGDKGVRWTARSPGDHAAGTMEIWLEPSCDGVVLHYFLRLDAEAGHRISARRARRVVDTRRKATKQIFWALGDQLDPGRTTRVAAPGELAR
jgi:hypothetical protein